MDIQDFDYRLPQDRIAQFPSPCRDDARLLVLTRETGGIHHTTFGDLATWLKPGDLLVINDTRVIPARIRGKRCSGGKVEILLCEPILPDGQVIPPVEGFSAFQVPMWACMVRSRGRLPDGTEILLPEGTRGSLHRRSQGGWCVKFYGVEDIRVLLEEVGEVPLPPYIRREPIASDRERYQTLFARVDGSIAAPTAGLHFTETLLTQLGKKRIPWTSVTLQVGRGTFAPVRTSPVEGHPVPPEFVEVGEGCCRAWDETRRRGGRVVAVGTTTVRALESAVDTDGRMIPFRGFTSLFILPGYRFRAVDALVTNFHLPRSTLLMLVVAFAGKEPIGKAYEEAIQRGYRFYSYGDAMLIL